VETVRLVACLRDAAPDVFARVGTVAVFGGLAAGAIAMGGNRPVVEAQDAGHDLWLGPLSGSVRYTPCKLAG